MRAAMANTSLLLLFGLAGCAREPRPPVPLAMLVLYDNQGMYGGQALWVAEDRTAFIQNVARPPAGKSGLWEKRYKTKITAGQWAEVERLVGAHHVLSLKMPDRLGVPDEAHPLIMAAMNEFIIDRTNALANLLLTRRQDVRVTRLRNDSLDLVAEAMRKSAKRRDSVFYPIFCVAHGTSKELPDVAHASRHGDASCWNRPDRLRFCSPVLFLLFSMVDDRGYYGWYSEPIFENGLPLLLYPAKVMLVEIRKNSLDTIVDTVVTWYDALAEILVRDERTVKATRRVTHA